MFSNNKTLSAVFLFLFLGFFNIFSMEKKSQQELKPSPKLTVDILRTEFLKGVDEALRNITKEELPRLKEELENMLQENLENLVSSIDEKEILTDEENALIDEKNALKKFIEQFDELWAEKTANFEQEINEGVARMLNFSDNSTASSTSKCEKIIYGACFLLTFTGAIFIAKYF